MRKVGGWNGIYVLEFVGLVEGLNCRVNEVIAKKAKKGFEMIGPIIVKGLLLHRF